jgi:Co/Zn/Cd efflux system component
MRYFLVGALSIFLAFIEIRYGHIEHHSMTLLADGLHYASHGVVAILSLFLSLTNWVRPSSIRAINLFFLSLFVAVSVGSIVALIATGYESSHVLTAPAQIAVIAVISIFVGIIQIRLLGHDHNGEKSGGISHDDICYGLMWHTYADVTKSVLFIFLACLSLIVTVQNYQEFDSYVALGIALFYGFSVVMLFIRVVPKLSRRE